MPILQIILVIAVVGVIVYLVTTFLPMPEPFKRAIYILAALLVLIYLLQALFGISLPGLKTG